MKILLIALTICTVWPAFAHSTGQELGTVEAWSNWYKENEEIDAWRVCADVLADFRAVNANRPYRGELADELPVGFKQGVQDGQIYVALSCRIRVFRQPEKTLAELPNR